jgi:hypothetical protein
MSNLRRNAQLTIQKLRNYKDPRFCGTSLKGYGVATLAQNKIFYPITRNYCCYRSRDYH